MKNIKYLFLLILLIPINAYAKTREYQLTCGSGPYAYEETFECYLKGDANVNYDAFSGEIEIDSTAPASCEIEYANNGLVSQEVTKGFKLTGTVSSDEYLKLNCKIDSKPASSGQFQIRIPNLKYHEYDDNSDASNQYIRSNLVQYKGYVSQQQTVETKPRSTDNPNSRLKSLSDENLEFTFSAFKTEYSLSVAFEVDKLNLVVIPNNEAATYEIVGSQNLEIGENTIDIYVTAPDGVSKTCYTLNINRLKRGEEIYYIEKDATLSSLSIEGYSINFESIIDTYNIHLKYDVDSVKVNAVATNPDAQVDISSTDNLNNGDKINITVTSQDGSVTKVYSINVKKDPKPKDYRSTIYVVSFVTAIAIVIIIILRTNLKNKGNPLLGRFKKKKEEQVNVDVNVVNSVSVQPIEPKPVETFVAPPMEQSQPVQPQVVESTIPAPPVPTPTVEPVQDQTNINQ